MCIKTGDFHIHTNCSDGALSPQEIVMMAKEKQLSIISITDHNTISGIEEAIRIGQTIGVEVIPGIELSIDYETEMHLLGYCFDINNVAINQYVNFKREWEFSELVKFIRRIRKKINNISKDDFMSLKTINVITITDFMIEKGYVTDRNEAYRLFFQANETISINKNKLSPKEGINLINNAGGIPVLAHPSRLGGSYDEIYDVLVELKKYGLVGLECYHKCHSIDDIKEFVSMANKLNLIITGGSDFHSLEDSKIYNQIFDPGNFQLYSLGKSESNMSNDTFLCYIS